MGRWQVSSELETKAPREPVTEASTAAPAGGDSSATTADDPMESEDGPAGAAAVEAAPLLPPGTALYCTKL